MGDKVDIIRDTKPKKKKRAGLIAMGIVGLVAVTFGIRSLPTAAPTYDRALAWMDTVEQGTMIRQIRGPGTLVPEGLRLITAVTNGRVEEITLLPGATVNAGDVLLRMSNPDVDLQLLQAQTQQSQAQSQLIQLRATLRQSELAQRGAISAMETQLAAARREYTTNQRLYDTNPEAVARSELERTRDAVADLEQRLDFENQRLTVMRETQQEQIDAQQLQVDRLGDQVAFNRDRLASMTVRAGRSGTLAPLATPLQAGQYVTSGQELARIVEPGRLKAEIRIPQTQAQEIVVGQTALIDTRSDTIVGTVTRIDPSVRGGSVTIDVALPSDLPASARPDLTVDGNVVIQELINVIYMQRPTFGQANSRVSVFKVSPDGQYADRINIQLGASSVNEIEIISGLQPGDVVILADMSQFDSFDRVRIR